MTAPVAIDVALRDRNLLGAALGDVATWSVWLSILKAAYGRPLNERERELFASVAGGREPPRRKVKELVAIASRRSGKGRVGAACAVHAALLTDHSAVLAPGETGVVACVSPTRAQAAILLDYSVGYLDASPLLRGEVADVTADEIRLKNGNVICTLTSDYRSLRGRTLLLAIMDESAFLRSEESSVPDIETARALLPGLATTNGMLCILSSPYRRAGLLFERYRRFFGQDDADVLVVQAPSRLLNPTLGESVVVAAQESDAVAAASEWLGEFRTDLSGYLDDATIEAAIDYGRPLELPPRESCRYSAFVDASGGRGDAYVIAIAHKEGERIIADVVRGVPAPFNPQTVTQEFAELAKQYGCVKIVGDNYSADWVTAAWRDAGLAYERAAKVKSQIYLEALPLWTRAQISIPDHKQLLRELRSLERRTHRSGKDTVDHGRNGSDDYCNALCGVAVTMTVSRYILPPFVGIGAGVAYMSRSEGDVDGNAEAAQRERERAAEEAAERYLNERMAQHIAAYGGRRF
jgi:hypothetical protein